MMGTLLDFILSITGGADVMCIDAGVLWMVGLGVVGTIMAEFNLLGQGALRARRPVWCGHWRIASHDGLEYRV